MDFTKHELTIEPHLNAKLCPQLAGNSTAQSSSAAETDAGSVASPPTPPSAPADVTQSSALAGETEANSATACEEK